MIEAQVVFAVRVLVVVVFATAALGKLRGRDRLAAFAASLGGLVPGPARVRTALAAAVAGAEAVVAVLAAVPGTTPYGLVAATAALLVLAAAVAVAITRRTPVPCHCFGSAGDVLGPRHLVRNLLLAAVAAVGAALALTGTAAPSPGPSPGWAGLAAAGLLGLGAAVLFVHSDALVAAVRPAAPARR